MKLELITLTGPKIQEDVYEVILPTADGGLAIYPMHAPLVVAVVPGVITVRRKREDNDDQREMYAGNGGIAVIDGKHVRLLVDEADHADDIVEQEAAEALARAKQLKTEAKDQVQLDRAQSLIDRQAVRLKLAELRRNHRPRR